MFTKFALNLIVLIMLISMAGCGSMAANPASTPGLNGAQGNSPETGSDATSGNNQQLLPIIAGKGVNLNLDVSADGTTQTLGINELMAITLESNPSTGYSWFAKSSNPDVISQEGEAQYNEPASNSTEVALGAAGTETLYLKAASTGSAMITLEYKRGWETNVAPEKTLTITVEVK
jgi:predicted secreted protein/uncharacterized protein YceK